MVWHVVACALLPVPALSRLRPFFLKADILIICFDSKTQKAASVAACDGRSDLLHGFVTAV